MSRATAMQAAAALAKSGLKKKNLGRIWTLADADRDGELSRHEFAVAMHLAACVKGGLTLPRTLPACLAAVGKRSGGGDETGVADMVGGGMVAATTEREEANAKAASSTGGQFDRRGKLQEGLELLSCEERDNLYAMSALERAGYDVVFMQVCTYEPRVYEPRVCWPSDQLTDAFPKQCARWHWACVAWGSRRRRLCSVLLFGW